MYLKRFTEAARLSLCAFAAAFLCSLQVAHAQQTAPAPSQVAPPSVPLAPSAPTRIILPRIEAGAAIPPGAKALLFRLTGFVVEGEFEVLAGERRALEAPLAGKRISVAQVFEFATALQAIYVRAGYPLVRVVVTPQELGQSAKVKIRIVDGFIERIDGSALPESARRPVLAVISSLLNKRRLTQAELERRLLIAGGTPGLTLNAVFSGGNEVGGAILVLTGSYRPVSMSVYSDDAMPQVFGTGQMVTAGSLNSVLGWGEQISVSAAGLPDRDISTTDPTRRYLSAVLSIPLGTDGWRLEGGVTRGTTTPRVDLTSRTQGQLTQGYARLAYDVIKRRDIELTFSARFDSTDEQINSLLFDPSVPVSLDRLRVLRGGVDGVWRLRESGTVLTYGATVSRGIKAFGARMAADADPLLPLSRAGADAVFTKLQGRFEVTQSLPEAFFVSLSGNGQTSFNKALLTSEQFDIVGARMLSGYTGGAFAGDTAWVVRGELGRPFALPNPVAPTLLTPYLFAATGERIFEQASALELGSEHASNVGGGLRMNVAGQQPVPTDLSGFIEFSRRHSDDPRQREGWRLFAGGSLRY